MTRFGFTPEDLMVKFEGDRRSANRSKEEAPPTRNYFLYLYGALCDVDSWRGIALLDK